MYRRKCKILNLSEFSLNDLNREARRYVERENDAYITAYTVIGYSSEQNCSSMSHGAVMIETNDNRKIILEYGNVSAITPEERDNYLTDYKHPTNAWVVCILRYKEINVDITLHDILIHAELWKQEIPYLWKRISYPNNCYGYVDSLIITVFKDEILSKNGIRWELK